MITGAVISPGHSVHSGSYSHELSSQLAFGLKFKASVSLHPFTVSSRISTLVLDSHPLASITEIVNTPAGSPETSDEDSIKPTNPPPFTSSGLMY